MNWIRSTFVIIQNHTLQVTGTNLYFEALKILKSQLIEPIYNQLFKAICDSLQKYQSKELKRSYQPLEQIIFFIGVLGLKDYRNIILKKQDELIMFWPKSLPQQHPFDTEYFSKKFKANLINYLRNKYTRIANQLIILSTPEYVSKALQYLKIQQSMIQVFYPNKKVKDDIIFHLNQILVSNYAQELIKKISSGLFSMLERSEFKNIKQLYELIKRSQKGFKIYLKQYQYFIQSKGNQILQKSTNLENDEKMGIKKQPITQVIEDLYRLYSFMQKITRDTSNNDQQIKSSETYGFQYICNKTDKIWSYLAHYSDSILKKEQATSLKVFDNQNQMADLKTVILRISKYLYSYDAFIKLYQKLLGFRILFENFKRKELEVEIIHALKLEIDANGLSSILLMINDYTLSQNFKSQNSLAFKKELGFGLQVMILTSGSWQINDSKNGKNAVPPELMKAVQLFENVYSKQLPNRALTWVFNYGIGVVLAHFQNDVKHILMVNNYQLCILLYFQRHSFKTAKLSEILQQIVVDDMVTFNASLIMLLKIKLILKQENSQKIDPKDQLYSFNINFKHGTPKVRCFQIPRVSEGVVTQNGQLVLQRSQVVDALIVKIMKSKRNMLYTDLIQQVQRMCKTFKVEVGLIKERIEHCQKKEFLQRDETNMNLLMYVS